MARKEKILKKAQKFIQKGAFEKAVAEYMSLKDMDPSDVSLRLHLGDLFVQMGSNEEAVKEYVSAAKISARLGFYLKAIAVYKRALKVESNNTDIHYKLAELYTKQRLIADAMSQYTIILNVFEQKGMDNETLELLKKIVDLDASNVSMKLRLAVLYRKLDFVDDSFEIYGDIYAALKEAGNFKKAEDIYLDLYEASPEEPRVLNCLVDIYRGKGEDEESLKYSHALLKHYVSIGELEEASSVSRDILSIKSDDGEGLSFLESYGVEEVSDVISAPGSTEGEDNAAELVDTDDGTEPEIGPAAEPEEEGFDGQVFASESGQDESSAEDASEEELEIFIEGFDGALPDAGGDGEAEGVVETETGAGEGPREEEGDGGDETEGEYVDLDISGLSDEWREGPDADAEGRGEEGAFVEDESSLEAGTAEEVTAEEVTAGELESTEESAEASAPLGEETGADVEFIIEGFGDEAGSPSEPEDADDNEDADLPDISFDTTAFEDEEKFSEESESLNEDIIDNESTEESDNEFGSADEFFGDIESPFDVEKKDAEGPADETGAFEVQEVPDEEASEELEIAEDVMEEDEPPLEAEASIEEIGGVEAAPVDEEFTEEPDTEVEPEAMADETLDEPEIDEEVEPAEEDEPAGEPIEGEPSVEAEQGGDDTFGKEAARDGLDIEEDIFDQEPFPAEREPFDDESSGDIGDIDEAAEVIDTPIDDDGPEGEEVADGSEAELEIKEDGFGDDMAEPEASGEGLDDGAGALEGPLEENTSEEEEAYLDVEPSDEVADDMESSLDMEESEDEGPADEEDSAESSDTPEESFDVDIPSMDEEYSGEEIGGIEEQDIEEEVLEEEVAEEEVPEEETPDEEEVEDLEAEDGLAAESLPDELEDGYDGGTFTEAASEELVNAEELLEEEPSMDINHSEDEGGVADKEAPDEETSEEWEASENPREEDGQSFEAKAFIEEVIGAEAATVDEDDGCEADTEEVPEAMAEETPEELEAGEEVESPEEAAPAEQAAPGEELIESENSIEIEQAGGESPLEENIFENEPGDDFETVEDEAFTEELEEVEGQAIDEEAGIGIEENAFDAEPDAGPEAFEDTLGDGLSETVVESDETPEDEASEDGDDVEEEILAESDGGDAASDEEAVFLEGAVSEEPETASEQESTEEFVEADTPREPDYPGEEDGEADDTFIVDGFDEEGASPDESGEGLAEYGEETETPADGEALYEERAIEENIPEELDTPEELTDEGEPPPDEVEVGEPEEEETETSPGEESAEDTEPSLDVGFEEDEGPSVTTETADSLDASEESAEAEFSSVDEESSDEEIEEIDGPVLENEAFENPEPAEETIEADNLGGADNEFVMDDFEEETSSTAESGEGLEDEGPDESDSDADAEFLKESEAEEFEGIDESGPLEEVVDAGKEASPLEEDVFHEEIGAEEIPVDESSSAEENSFDEETPEEFEALDNIEPSEESAEEGGGEEGDMEEGDIEEQTGAFRQESFVESGIHEEDEPPYGLEMEEDLAASDDEPPEVSEPTDGLSGEEPSLDIEQAEEDTLPAEEEPFIKEELSLEDDEAFEDEALEEKFTSVIEDDSNVDNSMGSETEDEPDTYLSDEPAEEALSEEDGTEEQDIAPEMTQDEQTPLEERPVDETDPSMGIIYTEPELEEAIQNLARTSSAGDVYETYEELKSGLENQLSSEDAETHFNLGREYLEMELFKEASREFKIALKDSRLDIDCYINLAKCSMAEANHEEAIIYFLKVLKGFNGEESERRGFLYDLASSYASSGQESEANGIFRSIYAIDPRFKDVAKKIKALRKKRRSIPMDDSMLEVELL